MDITPEVLEDILLRVQPQPQTKHFTHCTVRFKGTRTHEAVEDFLASVDYYKIAEEISDVNAIKGLDLLLEGPANTWWTLSKTGVTTWEKAKQLIRDEFAPKPPAYRIYLDVFSNPQEAHTPTGKMVAEKRALLARLEPPPSEATQLDMIYGLLLRDIRDRIPREEVNTFEELLVRARLVEANRYELIRNEHAGRWVLVDGLASTRSDRESKSTVRCGFCRRGRAAKRKTASMEHTTPPVNEWNTSLARSQQPVRLDFCAIETKIRSRPEDLIDVKAGLPDTSNYRSGQSFD